MTYPKNIAAAVNAKLETVNKIIDTYGQDYIDAERMAQCSRCRYGLNSGARCYHGLVPITTNKAPCPYFTKKE